MGDAVMQNRPRVIPEERLTKAERLLQLVRRVQARPHQTGRELACACGVTERTFYRDMVDLTLLGLHIEVDPARGGYVLASRSFLPPLNLTAEELLAVQVALDNPVLTGTPWGRSAASARDKILAGAGRAAAGAFPAAVHVQLHPRPLAEDTGQREILALLQQTLAERRSVVLTYDSSSDPPEVPRERTVDPYRLFFHSRSWYLAAFCHHFREPRVFKVKRIRAASLTDRVYEWPKDFDLEAWLQGAWRLFLGEEPVTVRARFSPQVAHLVRETQYHPTEQVADEPDGGALFSATVHGWREISWWLLGFGDQVEVLEPPELRAELRRVGRWLAGRYLA